MKLKSEYGRTDIQVMKIKIAFNETLYFYILSINKCINSLAKIFVDEGNKNTNI